MKKILYLILFLPVVAFSQVRPDQAPIIDANNTLYFYTMVNGAVRRVAITSLDSLINVGTNRDTVYTVTNIPDTSGVTPQQGDILVNAALDTIGFYDGNTWTIVPIAVDLTAYVTRTELTDTSTAIRGDFPVITRDTVYQITAVSDTSTVTPNQGDVFILDSKDTLGVYDGGAWVLFYGGGGGDGIYGGSGSLPGNVTVTMGSNTLEFSGDRVYEYITPNATYSEAYQEIGSGANKYEEYKYSNNSGSVEFYNGIRANHGGGNIRSFVSCLAYINQRTHAQLSHAVGFDYRAVIVDSAHVGIVIDNDEYYFPNTLPSFTLNDTTIMAWRGTGAAAEPIGFLPYSGGTDDQNLSASRDTIIIESGNSIRTPGAGYLRDSVTTTTLTIDLKEYNQAIVSIRMTSATNLTLTINNPWSVLTDATAPTYEGQTGVYTFRFWDISGTDNITWPANFYDMNGTALGVDALTTGTAYTCYYDPVEAAYFCK